MIKYKILVNVVFILLEIISISLILFQMDIFLSIVIGCIFLLIAYTHEQFLAKEVEDDTILVRK